MVARALSREKQRDLLPLKACTTWFEALQKASPHKEHKTTCSGQFINFYTCAGDTDVAELGSGKMTNATITEPAVMLVMLMRSWLILP
jgi:hypothetical protein